METKCGYFLLSISEERQLDGAVRGHQRLGVGGWWGGVGRCGEDERESLQIRKPNTLTNSKFSLMHILKFPPFLQTSNLLS